MGANRTFKIKVKLLVEKEAIIEMSSISCPEREEVLKAINEGHTDHIGFTSSQEDKIVGVISDPTEVEESD